MLGDFLCFLSSVDFFSKSTASENSFGNTIRASNWYVRSGLAYKQFK